MCCPVKGLRSKLAVSGKLQAIHKSPGKGSKMFFIQQGAVRLGCQCGSGYIIGELNKYGVKAAVPISGRRTIL